MSGPSACIEQEVRGGPVRDQKEAARHGLAYAICCLDFSVVVTGRPELQGLAMQHAELASRLTSSSASCPARPLTKRIFFRVLLHKEHDKQGIYFGPLSAVPC